MGQRRERGQKSADKVDESRAALLSLSYAVLVFESIELARWQGGWGHTSTSPASRVLTRSPLELDHEFEFEFEFSTLKPAERQLSSTTILPLEANHSLTITRFIGEQHCLHPFRKYADHLAFQTVEDYPIIWNEVLRHEKMGPHAG